MSAQDQTDTEDAEPVEATLADLLLQLRRHIALELRVSAPARVVTYNALTQRADVTLEQLPVRDGVPLPPIAIPDVPVRFTASALGYFSVPILPGTTGHVVVMDRCIDLWMKTGAPGDPINGRCHALADAVFEPGLHADTAPLTPPPSLVAAVMEGAQVHLGANAASSAILGTEFFVALSTFLAAVAGESAIIPASATAATVLNGLLATFLSTKVRVAP